MGRQPRALQLVTAPPKICRISARVMVVSGLDGMDDHRDAVKGDGDLHELLFRAQQLPGGGPQVGGPLGGGLDAGAGAAALHIDAETLGSCCIKISANFSAKGCTEVEPATQMAWAAGPEPGLQPQPPARSSRARPRRQPRRKRLKLKPVGSNSGDGRGHGLEIRGNF